MQAQAHYIFIYSEYLEVFQVHFVNCPEFFGKIFFAAINMSIVHMQAAYPPQPQEFTLLFESITGPVFSQPQGKILITSGLGCKNFMMMRAIHRPQVIFG